MTGSSNEASREDGQTAAGVTADQGLARPADGGMGSFVSALEASGVARAVQGVCLDLSRAGRVTWRTAGGKAPL